MKMKGYKLYVNDLTESEQVQRKAFRLGYEWVDGEKVVQNYAENYFFLYEKNSNPGYMTRTASWDSFVDHRDLELISIADFLALEEPPEPKKDPIPEEVYVRGEKYVREPKEKEKLTPSYAPDRLMYRWDDEFPDPFEDALVYKNVYLTWDHLEPVNRPWDEWTNGERASFTWMVEQVRRHHMRESHLVDLAFKIITKTPDQREG